MKTRIVQIFCTPREGDLLLRTTFQLRDSFLKLKAEGVEYVLDVHICLSRELVKWEDTALSRHYFYDRFLSIKEEIDFCKCEFTISEDSDVLGPFSHRRSLVAKYPDAASFTFLDPDLCFDPEILTHIHTFSCELEARHPGGWILSPQTVRLWDEGWDLLVNKEFLSKPVGFCREADMRVVLGDFYKVARPRSLELAMSLDAPINHPTLGSLPYFHRMRLGWLTTISSSLLKRIPLPLACHYGYMDEHFMWTLFKIGLRWNLSPERERTVQIACPQYKIINSLVGDSPTKPLLSTEYITLTQSRDDLKKKSEESCKESLLPLVAGSLCEEFQESCVTRSLGKV